MYGQDTQYAQPQSFGTNLSPIIEAALQRKKQSQEQQQQMMLAIGKLAGVAGKYAQGSQQAGPGASDVSQPGYNMNDAVAGSAGGSVDQYRISSYGPESSDPTKADYNETVGARDNQLRPGDVAVSPDMRSQFPLGSHLRIGTTPDVYTVSDFTNPRLHRRVDIYNGQDMGTQTVSGYSQGGVVDNDPSDMQGREREGGPLTPEEIHQLWLEIQHRNEVQRKLAMNEPQGYAQGGVVPLPENAEGVLGWRTWPDPDSRADIGLKPDTPIKQAMPQHFASGGVASFTDPYGDRRSQYADHLGPMADVSGIAGVIARQRMFQQEQQQKQISEAMDAANKYMQKRQSDEIANKVLSQLPSYGVSTQGFEGQGSQGLQAVQQLYGLQQSQNAEANKAEDRVNKQYSQGLQDLNNEDKYINHDEANSYVTTTDANGNTVRVPSGSRLGQEVIRGGSNPSQPGMAPTTMNVLLKRQQSLQDLAASERASNMKANQANVPFSRQAELDSISKQISPQAGAKTGTAPPITRQDLPSPNTAAPQSDGSLKQEALDAIKRGADPEAVKARFKQLSGSDF